MKAQYQPPKEMIMHPKNRMFLFFVAVMLVVSLACAGSASPTPTAVPTNTSVPTSTAVPSSPTPEKVTFKLDTTMYTHPSGAFTFYPPEGWTIENTDYDVYITDPVSGTFFYVAVTNQGYQLDATSYETYVNNVENFYYASLEGHKQSEYGVSDAKDVYVVEKTYLFEGKKQYAKSVYNQFGQVSFVYEILAPESAVTENSGYLDLFDEFFKKLEVSADAGVARPIYELSWNFVGPDNSMSISVPIGWLYQLDDRVTYNDAVIETLTSPDGAALIENISVVDGNTYTMGNAGEMALFLLNQRYSSGGGDVRVSNIQTLADGSEYWTWKSSKGGYSGITNFELRKGGAQVLLLSFVTADSTLDLYGPLFDRVLGSYTIP